MEYWVWLWQVWGGGFIRVARAGTLGWSTGEGNSCEAKQGDAGFCSGVMVVVVGALCGWG